MSYIFNGSETVEFQRKVKALEQDIKRFAQACRSDWPRPIDYTNLMDAQHALKSLKTSMTN